MTENFFFFVSRALVGVKALNAYSHWAVEDAFERTAPTLVFLLMLGCRLVVDWQVIIAAG